MNAGITWVKKRVERLEKISRQAAPGAEKPGGKTEPGKQVIQSLRECKKQEKQQQQVLQSNRLIGKNHPYNHNPLHAAVHGRWIYENRDCLRHHANCYAA